MKNRSALNLLSIASVCVITGCATTTIKENPVAADLAPMAKPDQGSIRYYQINKKTGEERFYEKFEVKADGSYGGVNNEGCAYEAFGDLISPAVSWSKCGTNPKWNSGENRGIVKKGEIWPLQLGNTVSYTYTQINALGEISGKPVLKCKVVDQVNIDVPAGNYDAYKVRCRRSEANWSRTRMYYFSPELGVELKYVNSHSSKGVEQDFEFLRSEPI